MSLEAFVELYRLCQKPSIEEGGYFRASTSYLQAKPLIQRIVNSRLGRVNEVVVDNVEFDCDRLPLEGGHVQFSILLPAQSAVRFYANVSELLRISKGISRGEMPDEFYVVDLDCYFKSEQDVTLPTPIEALRKICRLIVGLSELAHYHDEKLRSGILKLVFIRAGSGADFKSVELETRVTEGIIKTAESLNVRLVDELAHSNASNDPHYSAKVGVFGTSLAEFVAGQGSGNAFDYLICHWHEFVKSYHRDLSTYLSGFAFHKAKVEVAEAELKIANEFSKVLNDILGKLLGIPISFAAVLAIQKDDGLVKQVFVVFGILVACLILSRVVANQQRQFKRIESSKNIVIGAIEGKKEAYPEDLKSEVSGLALALDENSEFLRKTLIFFRVLCWLPLFAAVGYMFYIHCKDILSCFLSLSSFLGGHE